MSTHTYYDDEITRLQYEYKSLKDEVVRNNRQIQHLQIRDMESLDNMKHFLDKKRQLNNRAKHLKLLILKNYLDRRGCSLKTDEWLTALNISPDYAKPEDDNFGSNARLPFDNASELDGSGNRKLDQFIDELRFKVETVVNTVTADDVETKPGLSLEDGDSDGIHIDKVGELSSESIDSIMRYFEQPVITKAMENRDTQTSPHRPSTPVTADQQVQTGEHDEPSQPNYPANVELKSLRTPPPILAADFATKYDIKKKHKTDICSIVESAKKDKRRGKTKQAYVGDYIIPRGNISTMPCSHSSSQPPAPNRVLRFLRTGIIVALIAALCYYYPALPNCLLLLKDGVENTRDELARLLDSIILWYIPEAAKPVVVRPEPTGTWDTMAKYLENLYARARAHLE